MSVWQQDSSREGDSDEFPRRRRLRVHWTFLLYNFLVGVCTMETGKRWVDPDGLFIQNDLVLAALWGVAAVSTVIGWKRTPQWESLRQSEPWKDEEGLRRDWSRRWDD